MTQVQYYALESRPKWLMVETMLWTIDVGQLSLLMLSANAHVCIFVGQRQLKTEADHNTAAVALRGGAA